MGHIFISYSIADRLYAEQLMEQLRNQGFDVWLDDRADHGDAWLEVVEEALEACSAVVVVMSPAAADSDWVEREILLSLRHEKPLVPLLLEGEGLPVLKDVPAEDITGGRQPGEAFFARLSEITPPVRRYGLAIAPSNLQVRRVLSEDDAPPDSAPTLPRPPRRRINPIVIALVVLLLGMATGSILLIRSSHRVAFNRLLDRARTFEGGNLDWLPHEETVSGVELMLVPVGCFSMGSADDQLADALAACSAAGGSEQGCQAALAAEQPAHEQCFSEPFWIGRYPITNEDYARCVADEICPPALVADIPGANGPQKPVTGISLAAARAYADWLSDRTGEEFALPTEAEWEYAARGPEGWVYPWGDEFEAGTANFCDAGCAELFRETAVDDGFAESSRVDAYTGTGESWVDALDLAGNVWEWTASPFSAYPLTGQASAQAGQEQAVRGGAWNSPAYDLRAAGRRALDPETRELTLGFRVVMRSAGGP